MKTNTENLTKGDGSEAPDGRPVAMHFTGKTERVRGFQPPWRTVEIHECPSCGANARIYQNWRGSRPPFAVACQSCSGEASKSFVNSGGTTMNKSLSMSELVEDFVTFRETGESPLVKSEAQQVAGGALEKGGKGDGALTPSSSLQQSHQALFNRAQKLATITDNQKAQDHAVAGIKAIDSLRSKLPDNHPAQQHLGEAAGGFDDYHGTLNMVRNVHPLNAQDAADKITRNLKNSHRALGLPGKPGAKERWSPSAEQKQAQGKAIDHDDRVFGAVNNATKSQSARKAGIAEIDKVKGELPEDHLAHEHLDNAKDSLLALHEQLGSAKPKTEKGGNLADKEADKHWMGAFVHADSARDALFGAAGLDSSGKIKRDS